ncbi:hypothetical protein IHN59_19320, partial [Deinococcus sp. 23YEL01]|nr:hypothetical protein [Deinococcus sp. 23YEL01]
RARNAGEARDQSLQAVRQAAWLVSARASPDDNTAYRQMLMRVAERTANAAREGGFLGIGGKLVDEKEQEVLDELRRLLFPDGMAATTASDMVSPAPDGSGNSG